MNQAFTDPDALSRALDWASQQTAWWHDSGNLHITVLKRIAAEAQRIGARRTAETGCGLSTIILSTLAERHLCFTVDVGDPLLKVRTAPALNAGSVEFVVGPAQHTVGAYPFEDTLDLVLIDGPHGFPFPHLEYYHFYPRIRPGGVLVLDDIHIPIIRPIYDLLCDDAMWRHLGNELKTAFFERTDAPTFDPKGDGWEKQNFNLRHFPDAAFLDHYVPGWQEQLGPSPAGPLPPITPAVVEALEARLSTAQAEIATAQAEIAAVRGSTSWRVTAPLRLMGRLLRGR